MSLCHLNLSMGSGNTVVSALKTFHHDKFTHAPGPFLCSRARKGACLGGSRLKSPLGVSSCGDLKEALGPRLQSLCDPENR